MPATAPVPVPDQVPAPPDLIEDRYRSLMWTSKRFANEAWRTGDNSQLWYVLDRALQDIVYGLFQHDGTEQVDAIVEHLHSVIRETAVEFVADAGSAEWSGRRPWNVGATR